MLLTGKGLFFPKYATKLFYFSFIRYTETKMEKGKNEENSLNINNTIIGKSPQEITISHTNLDHNENKAAFNNNLKTSLKSDSTIHFEGKSSDVNVTVKQKKLNDKEKQKDTLQNVVKNNDQEKKEEFTKPSEEKKSEKELRKAAKNKYKAEKVMEKEKNKPEKIIDKESNLKISNEKLENNKAITNKFDKNNQNNLSQNQEEIKSMSKDSELNQKMKTSDNDKGTEINKNKSVSKKLNDLKEIRANSNETSIEDANENAKIINKSPEDPNSKSIPRINKEIKGSEAYMKTKTILKDIPKKKHMKDEISKKSSDLSKEEKLNALKEFKKKQEEVKLQKLKGENLKSEEGSNLKQNIDIKKAEKQIKIEEAKFDMIKNLIQENILEKSKEEKQDIKKDQNIKKEQPNSFEKPSSNETTEINTISENLKLSKNINESLKNDKIENHPKVKNEKNEEYNKTKSKVKINDYDSQTSLNINLKKGF